MIETIQKSLPKYIIILLFIFAISLNGCVIMSYDEKASSIRVHSKDLKDFEGWYLHEAKYVSKSIAGFHAIDMLVDIVLPDSHHLGTEHVNISIPSNDEMLVVGYDYFRITFRKKYILNKDFYLDEGRLIISEKVGLKSGTTDSPGFGVAGKTDTWVIDENKDLAIVSSVGGLGIGVIIPIAGGGKTLSIFERVKDKETLQILNDRANTMNN